jgi:mRNA-degrading endonuclease RelE of RelBE toxin-antitoxin system|tara:strand:+ start:4207 stop:4455 length:249 start_codon:yes stop_codon:yes gene_type:complete
MFTLLFSEQFEKSFSKIDNKNIRKQIWKKIQELEQKAPLGKKLKGNPYWSIHINKFRVVYELKGDQVLIADILKRKGDYREL